MNYCAPRILIRFSKRTLIFISLHWSLYAAGATASVNGPFYSRSIGKRHGILTRSWTFESQSFCLIIEIEEEVIEGKVLVSAPLIQSVLDRFRNNSDGRRIGANAYLPDGEDTAMLKVCLKSIHVKSKPMDTKNAEISSYHA